MDFQPAGPVTRLAPSHTGLAPSHYLQGGFDRNLDPDYNITKFVPFPSIVSEERTP